MLRLLHLSDLHFVTEDEGTQWDRDTEIRAALLEDLGGERSNFDAVLITGDVAYHGREKEFDRATKWFDLILKKCGVPAESLFTVPGNHDVNQKHVATDSVMWDSHKVLRGEQDVERRERLLRTKCEDQSFDFLSPLAEYRAFAAQHGRLSPTSSKELAWSSQLISSVDGALPVNLHGLNSAFLSDSGDTKANLLVSQFQFFRLARQFNGVSIVMCHHPPSWLLDGDDAENRFRAHAHLVLTGHEHTSRCYPLGKCLRVCAGAVHPSRGESNWNPTYNVIRLSLDMKDEPELVIQVESRAWHKTDFCFVASPYPGSGFYEHRTPFTVLRQTPGEAVRIAKGGALSSNAGTVPEKTETSSEAEFAAARRKLIIHFYRLGLVTRFNVAMAAGVWEDGDDAYDGATRWARVFDRAERNKKLHALWTCVASHDNELASAFNPFSQES